MANVGRRADAEVFAELVKRMTTATRVEDGWVYASALAHVEDPALARQFLALTLGDAVPIADACRGCPAWSPATSRTARWPMPSCSTISTRCRARTTEQTRPFLLPGAASGFNEAARATALIADQKRLLGDAGEKAAKEAAAAIELKSRIRTRDSASLAASLSRTTTGKR